MTNQQVNLTLRERFNDIRVRIYENKNMIINSLYLVLIMIFCISLANRRFLEFVFADFYEKLWLLHAFMIWPLIAGAIFTLSILVYGLFVDQMALDKEIRLIKPERWKASLLQLWDNRQALALGSITTVILLGVQLMITYLVATVFNVQLIEIALFQAFISSIILYLTAFKTGHVRENGLNLNPISLSIVTYIIGFICYTALYFV